MTKPQKVLVAGGVIIFIGSIVLSCGVEIVGGTLMVLGFLVCFVGPLAATME